MGNPCGQRHHRRHPAGRHRLYLPPGHRCSIREVAWFEHFRRTQAASRPDACRACCRRWRRCWATAAAAACRCRAMSLRTLLDGIGTRLDETRETSRYLIGVAGLSRPARHVLRPARDGAVGEGRARRPGARRQRRRRRAFADLKSRLETPLGGMSTAFSASLFGLAGSLVLGFLDLQAGLAQNRFYNELEEMLSGYTRLSGGGPSGRDWAKPRCRPISRHCSSRPPIVSTISSASCRAARRAASPPMRRCTR